MHILSQAIDLANKKLTSELFMGVSVENFFSPLDWNPSVQSYAHLIETMESRFRILILASLKQLLESLDSSYRVCEHRKRNYLVKQTRSRTITTLWGDCTYIRTEYVHRSTKKPFCYVDRKLGYEPRMRYDPVIQSMAYAYYADHNSMIKVGRILGEKIHGFSLSDNWTEYAIPRQTIWKMVNRFRSIQYPVLPASHTPDILYLMADEKYVPLQRSSSQRKMIQLGASFEGVSHHSRWLQLTNKRVYSFPEGNHWEQTYDILSQIYELDQVKAIYILGDGAKWIQKGVSQFYHLDTRVRFALDKFHFQQAVNHITEEPSIKERIRDYAIHGKRKDLKILFEILLSQQPERKDLLQEKMHYILSNLTAIQTMYEEVPMGCSMEQEIQHTLQSCFTSVPKAYGEQHLLTYVNARIHHQNHQDLRKLYLQAMDTQSETKDIVLSSSLDWSLFDKNEDTHDYHLNKPLEAFK